MEMGPIDEIVMKPLRPYVQLLIDSIPEPDPDKRWEKRIELSKIELSLQSVQMNGCKFYPGCPLRTKKCRKEKPKLIKVNDRYVACFLYG